MSLIRFTEEHEWIRVDGGKGRVGITDYAQQQLGDVVYVEVPESGRTLKKGDEAAVVESVKAASEIYAPVSGTVVEGNAALAEDPAMVNESPLEKGWFFLLDLADESELESLMDEEAYGKYVASLD